MFQQPNPVAFFGGLLKIIQYFLNFFFKSMYSEYYPIIKMNNIFNLFYTFYEYVLYTAHYFWLSEKHRKVFNKLYPFLLLYMYTATIFQTKVHNRFSAWFLFL